jgi:hypothetical protein
MFLSFVHVLSWYVQELVTKWHIVWLAMAMCAGLWITCVELLMTQAPDSVSELVSGDLSASNV